MVNVGVSSIFFGWRVFVGRRSIHQVHEIGCVLWPMLHCFKIFQYSPVIQHSWWESPHVLFCVKGSRQILWMFNIPACYGRIIILEGICPKKTPNVRLSEELMIWPSSGCPLFFMAGACLATDEWLVTVIDITRAMSWSLVERKTYVKNCEETSTNPPLENHIIIHIWISCIVISLICNHSGVMVSRIKHTRTLLGCPRKLVNGQ